MDLHFHSADLKDVTEVLHPLALVHERQQSSPLVFRLREGRLLVGRSTECEIILTSDAVSRKHAELIVSGEEVRVRDLTSRNGTFIDDQRIESGVVRIGQRLTFGATTFVLEHVDGFLEEEVETLRANDRPSRSREALTDAQRRVYDLLLDGKSEKEVARELHLSQNTVHSHVQAIYVVFGVHSRAQLIAQALK